MSPDRWARVSAHLDELLDRPRAERDAYLERLRHADPDLCSEVESLLERDTIAHRLETPPTDLLAAASDAANGLPTGPEPVAPSAAGRFVLHAEIARGGMGIVYRATDPDIGRTLAVKVLLPAARADAGAEARFVREARITGQLQHPGVPPIHELGRLDDGTLFFAMKLIEGRTLAALIRDDPPARGGPLIGTFEQMCRTVAYAHSRGTLHRDLKPNNIMVGAFGEVQVMDWGLARQLRGAGSDTQSRGEPPSSVPDPGPRTPHVDETRAGEVRGTPAYMAPEQARGETERLDERCDVFGLGGILCALLTGLPPFSGSTGEMLRQSRGGDLSGAFARLDRSGADPELLAIARKCLAPDRNDRYRDADELTEAVTAYRESVRQKLERAELDRRTAQLQATAERRRRRLGLALGSALLVVLLVGFAAVTRFWLLADERRGLAETAQRSIQEERDRSDETARQARRAVKDSFVLATESAEFQKDGMQEPRRLLLDKGLAYFRAFAAQRQNDPGLLEDRADAHQRIAFILADRGQLRDALTEYGHAIELTEQLQGARPAGTRWRWELVGLYRLRAGVQLSLGARDDARTSLTRGRELLDALIRAEPANDEYQFADAQLLQSVGHGDRDAGRLDDALAAYTKSLEIVTKLNDAGFKKVKVAAHAAATLVSMGHVLKDQRQPAEAETFYRRAVRPLEDLLRAVPGPSYRGELARLHGSLAVVQGNQGHVDQALGSGRRAIELREELVRTNPQVGDYRHGLATSYINFGDELREAAARKGTFDPDAQSYREKALAVFLALLKEAPEQVSYHHGAAVAHLGVAIGCRRESKRPERAREHLTAARALWLDLDKRGLLTPEYRFVLAECEKQFGLLLLGSNDFATAADHFRKSKALVESVRSAGYKPDACRCEIARSITNLAVCAQETGKLDDALGLQAQALEMIEALAREKPNDAEFNRSARFTRTNMVELGKLTVQRAVVAPAKGTAGPALLPYYRARANKWQQLVTDFPKVAEFRTETASALVRVAGLHAAALAPGTGATPEERRAHLAAALAALKRAHEFGFTDAKHLNTDPAFGHCRNEPEFLRFLESLK